MLIYKRYIIKNILPTLIIIIFSLTSIVWITQILKFLHLIDKGVKISYFLSLIILVIPYLLFILLPFTTLISILYTYLHLSERRQLIILQNLGLNNLQIVIPGLITSLMTVLFSYYISASLLPLSYTTLKSQLNFIKSNYVSNVLEEKVFNTITKEVTVYFDTKLPNDTMQGLIIFDNRKPDKQAILFVKSGNIKSFNNTFIFQLNNGIRQIHDHNENVTSLTFDSLIIELANKRNLNLIQNKDNREINAYYIGELLNPRADLDKQRQIKLIAAGHQRLIWPMYNFILVFVALSIFLQQPYNRKSNLKQILITIFFVIVITCLHFIFQNFASKDLIFIYACYGNIIITIIFSIYIYFRRVI